MQIFVFNMTSDEKYRKAPSCTVLPCRWWSPQHHQHQNEIKFWSRVLYTSTCICSWQMTVTKLPPQITGWLKHLRVTLHEIYQFQPLGVALNYIYCHFNLIYTPAPLHFRGKYMLLFMLTFFIKNKHDKWNQPSLKSCFVSKPVFVKQLHHRKISPLSHSKGLIQSKQFED